MLCDCGGGKRGKPNGYTSPPDVVAGEGAAIRARALSLAIRLSSPSPPCFPHRVFPPLRPEGFNFAKCRRAYTCTRSPTAALPPSFVFGVRPSWNYRHCARSGGGACAVKIQSLRQWFLPGFLFAPIILPYKYTPHRHVTPE